MWGTSSSSKTLDLAVAGVVAITHASIDRLVLPLSSLLLDLTKQQSIVQLAGRSPLGQALAVNTWPALSCGENLSPKVHLWRKNDKYEV